MQASATMKWRAPRLSAFAPEITRAASVALHAALYSLKATHYARPANVKQRNRLKKVARRTKKGRNLGADRVQPFKSPWGLVDWDTKAE